MPKNLKEQTVSALFWNLLDKGGQQFFQIIFMLVLARLLSPHELGLIALLTVFISIANILQESGFSSALIRNHQATEADYSSTFYFNIAISILIYLLLFVASPSIASYYDEPILKNLSRVLFLVFIFNAFSIVQNVQLIKRMDFKTNAKITFVAVILSGIVAITMAYRGFGVWSLAMQQVVQALTRSILLWLFVRWHPLEPFRLNNLKQMSHYSFKLLLNSLFNQIAGNITAIVIGKKFSVNDAGLYSQGSKFAVIPQSVIATTLSGVAFPLLTKFGEDTETKHKVFRKIVHVICFVSFPLAAYTILAADSIVLVLLKEKWAGSIPILRYVAIGSSVLPLLYVITSLLQSLGKSGLLLSLEFARNVATILTIILTSRHGINSMVLGVSLIAILTFFCEYYITGKYIGYTFRQILKDVLPYAFISAISFFPLYVFNLWTDKHLILLLAQGIIGCGIYLVLLKILGSKVIDDFIELLGKRRQI